MEALILAGGKALAAYQVARLADAGVTRVIVSCAEGCEPLFESALAGFGPEIVAVGEPAPLGRGGGLRFAASFRQETGPVLALNGDELLGVDLRDLLRVHRARRAAATIVVSQVKSPFGVVEVCDDDTIAGFREAPLLPEWVSSGVYVLDEECIERLPAHGDHETTTFPELAAEGKLVAYRNPSFWLTVNTPKQLREADEFVRAHPELLPVPA